MTRTIFGFGLLIFTSFSAFGQEAAGAPEFEAAVVKPAEPLNMGPMMAGGKVQIRFGCTGGPGTSDPVRFSCSGMPLRALLVQAYAVKPYQISGPSWMESERFDINAKAPADATIEQFRLMLQRLLTDRFRMAIHHETKELPVYALVVGKNGHKLKEPKDGAPESPFEAALARGDAPPPPPPPPPGGGGGERAMMFMIGGPGGPTPGAGKGRMMMSMRNGLFELTGRRTTVASLADMLSNRLDRPVLDRTDIKGDYDFTLDFAPDDSMRGGMMLGYAGGPGGRGGQPPAAPGADTPDLSSAQSIFTAIQSQLGLKLEPKKGPVEMIVVDKAEKVPAEN